jgi:hypothetical protein
MQRPFELQQRHDDNRGGGRHAPRAAGCNRTDGERHQSGHERRQAHDGVHADRHDITRQQEQADEKRERGEHCATPGLGQNTAQTAKQPQQREGAYTGHAVAVRELALLPAPFEADQ